MPDEKLKQFVATQQISIEAEDAKAAAKIMLDGGGTVMSLSVNLRSIMQPQPGPQSQPQVVRAPVPGPIKRNVTQRRPQA